jgi:hypothetical protein
MSVRGIMQNRAALSFGLALLALALISTATLAQEREPNGIIGTDDRQILHKDDPLVGAVGHINITGFSRKRRCVGVLIAPDRVATAAECLVYGKSGMPRPPSQIHFVSGAFRNKETGHAKAKCTHMANLPYRHKRTFQPELADNLAVIVLDKKLAFTPLSLAPTFDAKPGTSMIHASMPRIQRAVRVHHGCRLHGRNTGY